MKKYVAIQNFSAEDQEGLCDRWKDTLICNENTTLKEIMKWANKSYAMGNPIIAETKEAQNE